ncbi:putative DNA topoisomerase [Medicago truncatula]|uniref:DNA topoisomerase I n=1 Tax=Medicago truncatula TaxID=3880 RepID=A0A072TSF3_MEDTR|nr:DNA topoisomerase 1 alpha [Medicago truncatula]KEH16475.1 DNA topoisomerase type I [Medicago truncatula]RHN60056.1 putative DNA topoisomerase [Medicago truncatula]
MAQPNLSKKFDDYDDDDDDDDQPITFKRFAKKSPLHSEVKKATSNSHGGQSNGKITDVHSSNGQTSKPSPMKPCAGIAKQSNSPSLGDKPNIVNVKNETKPIEHSSKGYCEDSEDDDDDKPLSSKWKIKSNHDNKVVAPVVIKKSSQDSDDDDDDVPLSAKFLRKPNSRTSDKKPVSKVQKERQNGSSTSSKQQKSSTLPVKRELENCDSVHSSVKKSKVSDSAASIKTKQVSVKCELKAKEEEDDDDDKLPISHSSVKKPKVSDSAGSIKTKQVSVKCEIKAKEEEDDDDDELPISHRFKKSPKLTDKPSSTKKISTKVTKVNKSGSTSFKKQTKSKQTKNKSKRSGRDSEYSISSTLLPSSGDGQKKWTTLVHNGVIFPPPYQPHGVKILYKGKPVDLTPEQEEVATMYAVMRDTDYMQKDKFKENFWNDWREVLGRKHVIQNLKDCDFTPIYDWHEIEKEKKKQMTTEEKKALKEEKMKQEEKYTWAIVDGVKEKVGNFRVEPPGLFRGRGEHPKMGKLKKRIHPSDITINIGKDAPIPECPIPGECWKDIRHDNTVTWLCYWNDPINSKLFKYVFLAASSSLKGQSDKEKYEKARLLKDYIENIRAAYTKDFTSKDITKQQIAVATYLIDKLALRAGNEKDDDEADTVGCCTLKVENVTREAPNKLMFNFLGKDSIKYENTVEVELPVYNAILKFQKDKSPGESLFDMLDTNKLNTHLKELMPGLTAKVFRTFNASITLDDKLNKDTKDGDVAEKIVVYNHANKEVAIICNHQRSVSKSHSQQMTKLNEKIDELQADLKELKVDLDRARKGKPPTKSSDGKSKRNLTPEALEKKITQTNAKIEKMQRDMRTKEDLKTVALGTSKINYLDPRITVAWCKRHEVPIEKMFTKSLLAKFAWAMDVDPDFRF